MKKILFLFLVMALAGACTQKSGYTITGTASNTSSTELFLEKISQQKRETIDTVTVASDGNFVMNGPLEEAGLFRLSNNQKRGVVLHLKPGVKVNVDINFDDLENYTVSGSEESKRFQEFNTFYADRKKEKQDLVKSYREEADSIKKASLLTTLRGWDTETVDLIKTKISEEQSTLLGLLMIGAVPAKGNKDFYNQFNNRLQMDLPNSDYAKEFDNLTAQINSQIEQPKVGDTVPEIAMENPKGEVVKLSDLRGKYVLIDFWAAWCGPCRRENPNIVEAYNKYNDKGFEVYSVSLDKTSNAWVRAIEQDNLDWPYHVSDLKFWNNAAAKQYGVKSIPANFLLDQNGKVIAANLRGPALQAKLAELFN